MSSKLIIGDDTESFTLVRTGDTLTVEAEWRNVGNIDAKNITWEEIYNNNVTVKSVTFSKDSVDFVESLNSVKSGEFDRR